jgi:beta-glucuronidase
LSLRTILVACFAASPFRAWQALPPIRPSPRSCTTTATPGVICSIPTGTSALTPLDQGQAQGFQRHASLDGWTPVTVPNAWNATDLSDASQRGGVGWYRTDFRAPSTGRGQSWVVRFESVNYRARVYLNGQQIGSHEGAYLPFEVPADKLRKRGINHLMVRVGQPPLRDRSTPVDRPGQTALPAAAGGNYSGITA